MLYFDLDEFDYQILINFEVFYSKPKGQEITVLFGGNIYNYSHL